MVILISLLMGLLLDIETLLKIIKMPIPVAIGLACQYICMPLVRSSTLFCFFFSISIPIMPLYLIFLVVVRFCQYKFHAVYVCRKISHIFIWLFTRLFINFLVFSQTTYLLPFYFFKGGTNSNSWTILLNGAYLF